MKLVPFPQPYLETNNELPFDVFDGKGRLLLAAGQQIEPNTLTYLLRWELFADEAQSMAWRRQLMGVDVSKRRKIAEDDEDDFDEYGAVQKRLSLGREWSTLVVALDSVLREPRADPGWVRELCSVRQRVRQVAERALDASVCHLIYTGGMHANLYSCHQALRCMLIAGECARAMGWSTEMVESLENAALTMNVAMRALQDMLAQRDTGLSTGMRMQVANHPREAARLLAAAGVTDAVWLSAVMLHHDAQNATTPPEQLTPAQQAAQLLRRVDIFCAKLSRRGRRAPLSGLRALREACLDADGHADEIGSALLKTMGMYPPGSFVQLAGGEQALVLSRGSRANAPRVAAFTDAQGAPVFRPRLRDTALPGYAVKSALDCTKVRERPNHEKLLALLR
ncbi:HD-GYP domain-containing protein [Azohydromonas lata]|uniref:HD-GYP domain-containing protein n=1 Tax=Azohydromonas lata TaxID=45677 RepID=UPI0008341DC1|nr:hypothetical protein [Azohydromonas lata]